MAEPSVVNNHNQATGAHTCDCFQLARILLSQSCCFPHLWVVVSSPEWNQSPVSLRKKRQMVSDFEIRGWKARNNESRKKAFLSKEAAVPSSRHRQITSRSDFGQGCQQCPSDQTLPYYHSSVKTSLLQKLSWPFLVKFPAPHTQTTMVARHCQWLLMSQKRTSHCSSRGLFLILCFVCEMKEGLNLYNRVILNLGFLASTSRAVIVLGLFPLQL